MEYSLQVTKCLQSVRSTLTCQAFEQSYAGSRSRNLTLQPETWDLRSPAPSVPALRARRQEDQRVVSDLQCPGIS